MDTRMLVACALALLSSRSATADGLTPEQAKARMVVPEGFRVEVFSSEPDVRQPVAACFDERGRMWVIEYLQYPNPAGLKPVTIDQYLRTEYDRVPEPPPAGPRGVDRIKILEDTDGDGRADKVTTFLEGLNLASGLAVGHGGVFVGQAPYLLFYPDRDKDDKPDGDPEVCLRGFGLQDAHATVNSLTWGPDGWLYGAQGSTVTASIRGIGFQQGIWRFHPRTKRFELFAEGGGNTWGLDFDRAGHAFGSSNGGFVAFHMVQGGYYWKGFAKHGPLHNPNTFGYFDSIKYQGAKPGGHVTPGGVIYKGESFPDAMRGAFIGGNLLSNTVYWYTLDCLGSTFSMELGGTLVDSKDPWFRPIDLLTGPDGSVFVVDWYDKRASHLDPRDNWDKTNGRIYKISHGDARKRPPIDLSRLSSDALIDLRGEANDWWPDTARRILAERRDPSVHDRLRRLVREGRDESLALRDLWALYSSGGLNDDTGRELLSHPLPDVRRWVIRLLGDEGRMDAAIASRLARDEPDVEVRSQLASTCQRFNEPAARAVLSELVRRDEDVADPHLPMLIWWAIERQMQSLPRFALTFSDSVSQSLPMVSEHLLERIARAAITRGDSEGFATCAEFLKLAPDDEATRRLVAGMDKGLEGRRLGAVPPELVESLARLEVGSDVASVRLGARLGSAPALAKAIELATESGRAEAQRVGLIDLIGQTTPAEGPSALRAMLERKEPATIHLAALNALGRYPGVEVANALLARYPTLPDPLRDRVRDLLCSRKPWAERLLAAIESKQVAAKDLRASQVAQIVQHGDLALTSRAEAVWGRLPGPGSPEKARRIAEVRGILPEGDKGLAARGRSVFEQHCGVCHRLFGRGEAIGPDLGGAERGNLEVLLRSIVDPSVEVRKEYQGQTIALKDGRILSGLVAEEDARTLTLIDSQRQRIVVNTADIEDRRASPTSVMPEGILDPLPDDQVRDLFRYIQSNGSP